MKRNTRRGEWVLDKKSHKVRFSSPFLLIILFQEGILDIAPNEDDASVIILCTEGQRTYSVLVLSAESFASLDCLSWFSRMAETTFGNQSNTINELSFIQVNKLVV